MAIESKSKDPQIESNKKRHLSAETREKISKSHKGKTTWNKGLTKENNEILKRMSEKISKNYSGKNHSQYGTHKSKETKLKLSISQKGKHISEEHKRKLRVYALNRVLENGTMINIGKNETKLLNEQEIKDNCKIERQYKIRKLGYCTDGYCKDTNTVYEVYELGHLRCIKKDLQRQQEIQKFLNCNFIIIWDK